MKESKIVFLTFTILSSGMLLLFTSIVYASDVPFASNAALRSGVFAGNALRVGWWLVWPFLVGLFAFYSVFSFLRYRQKRKVLGFIRRSLSNRYTRKMSKYIKMKKTRSVGRITRDAVVRAGDGVDLIQEKAAQFGKNMEEKWNGTKPFRTRTKEELERGAKKALSLGHDVKEGFQEGIEILKSRSKKHT